MNNSYTLITNKNTSGLSELFLKLSSFDTGRENTTQVFLLMLVQEQNLSGLSICRAYHYKFWTILNSKGFLTLENKEPYTQNTRAYKKASILTPEELFPGKWRHE